jgi:hypothetical protein
MRLLQENRIEYVESDPIQNVAERNQVVLTDERVQRALIFKKKKLQGQEMYQYNYLNMEGKM